MKEVLLPLLLLVASGCASAKLTMVKPLPAPVRELSLGIDAATTAPVTAQEHVLVPS